MKQYQQRLSTQLQYSAFFTEKSLLKQAGITKNSILRNKPEKFMRDSLFDYLKTHMKHSFFIENELSRTKRKLDIFTEVDGKFYFFEVKWLGESISACGTKISTTYDQKRAHDGVVQTLQYIEELINSMEEEVAAGYLVVFDARETQTVIDYKNYEFVEDQLKTYLPSFEALDQLYLKNVHSA